MTSNKIMGGSVSENRLINEKSPYLLQHAHNPVHWYAWSEDAFAAARAKNKPIFLSIGYSTCHWCHVMETESFEDTEIAGYLNETFVCIKVDREERPDIDSVYMRACQLLHGSGGWPLTIVMTPDKKPFFATTYLPKESRFGRMGMIELCQRIKSLWANEKERIITSAENIIDNINRTFRFSSADNLNEFVLDHAYAQIEKSYDGQFGGFESAPKFPTPHRLLFLLRLYHRNGNIKTLNMVKTTLTAMRLGGIWDHVGFGFHRYSTDRRWLLPHFEKMLYDQALMALVYLEVYQITQDSFFAKTAEEIFTYIMRDMAANEGGFFTAEDADSEGREGKFYLWKLEEIRQVLGQEEASLWEKVLNLQPDGNFSEEASGRRTGDNILHLRASLNHWSEELNMKESELVLRWEKARNKLFGVRKKRIHPLKDDKILTDWNGLMIAALSFGTVVLNKPEYADAARKTAEFVLNKMRDSKNRLLHRFRKGESAIIAYADDYAFMVWGLVNLYRATLEPAYLKVAVELQIELIRDFWDDREGGFFLTAKSENELPLRPKELYDGAIPSANSVSLFNLINLSRLTRDVKWEHKALELSRVFAGTVKKNPSAYTFFLMALDLAWTDGQSIDSFAKRF